MKLLNKLLSLVSVFVLVFSQISAPLVVLAQEATPSASEGPLIETTPQGTAAGVIEEPIGVPPEEQNLELPTPTPTPTPASIIESTSLPTPIPETIEETQHLSAAITENSGGLLDSIFGPIAQIINAFLTTDKADYSPTEKAVISGSGFNPYAVYTLIITSEDSPVVHFETPITTSSEGSFTYSYQLDGNYRATYQVEVRDQTGNIITTTTFTDASTASVTTVSVSNLSPTNVSVNQSKVALMTFTVSSSAASETFNSIKVQYSGTNKNDIAKLYLFQESGGSGGTFDFSSDTELASDASPSGGEFSINPADISMTTSTNYQFYIAADISATATVSNTVDAKIVQDKITFSSGTWPNAAGTSQFDPSGNSTIVADTTAPVLVTVTPVTTPTTDQTPNFTFSSTEAGTITYGGSCSDNDTSASVGNNTQSLNSLSNGNLPDGTYSNCTITVTDTAGNASSPLNVNTFVVDTTDPTGSFTINSGAAYSNSTSVSLNFSAVSSDVTELETRNGTSGSYAGPFTYTNPYTHSLSTSNGTKTVNVRLTDGAGNQSSTLSDTIILDTVAPTDPTNVASSSHTVSSTSTDNTIDMTWTTSGSAPGATDATSGVDGYSYSFTNSATDVPDTTKDAEETAIGTTSSALADGSWYFHLRTRDNAGNWTSTVHKGPFVIDTTGTIVIVKNSIPDDSQDFTFSRSFGDDFSLDDDSDGDISNQATFLAVPSGSHTVTENGVNGWQLTGLACDDSSSVDLESRTATIDVDAGGIVTCTFTNTKLGLISGYKFIDTNGNGVWDEDEDPDSEWTITLGGGSSDETTTDEDGYYTFEELLPGTYHICESIDDNEVWAQTLPSGNNSCDDGTSWHEVELSAGENVTDKNFGNFRYGRISGQKFEDLDGDGLKDDGESGLSGWTIFLDANDNGDFDNDEIFVETDGDGNYQFSSLTADTYKVREVLQNGWVQKTDNQDISITSGSDETVNFGNFKKVIIDVYKWKDLDADGVWDTGEPAVGEWDMTLSRETTTTTSTPDPEGGEPIVTEESAFSNLIVVPTAEDGKASFEVDKPGNYRVTEDTTQDNFQRTHPTDSFFDIFVDFSGQHTGDGDSITEDHDGQPLRFGNAPTVQVQGATFVPTSGNSDSSEEVKVLGLSTISVSDSGGTSSVELPDGTVITRTDGDPIDISDLTASEVTESSLTGLASGEVVDGALKWGLDNIELNFNPAITLNIFVGAALNGQILNVQRSTSGSGGWTNVGIGPPITCVVANGLCTFTATKASNYAATHTVTASSSTTSSDGGGTASMPGAPACSDSKPGSAPTLISAASGTNSVTLSWTKAADPTTYYLVTYGDGPGLQQYGNPSVGGSDVTTYTVSGLSGGTTYYFKVRAGNGCAPGDYSNEVSATPGGGFISGPATGFIPGVLGTQTTTEVETQGEVKGEDVVSPTPTAGPSPAPSGNIITGFFDFIKSIFSFLGGLLGL